MKSVLKKIKPDALYKVDEVVQLRLILNTQNRPDRDYIYRLIRDRRLIVVSPLGTKRKLIRIPGSSIINFIKQNYA